MSSLSCKGRTVFKRGILTSNIKYYSNNDDYEDPTTSLAVGRSWKIFEKEKLIVDSHNVNIVVKR